MGSPIIPVKSPITKTTRWPEVLEVLHLAHEHGVAEVDVGRGGIEADLDRERLAARELRLQGGRRDHVHAALRQEVEVVRVLIAASAPAHAAALERVAGPRARGARRAGRSGARPPGCARRGVSACRPRATGTASCRTIGPGVEPLVDEVDGGAADLARRARRPGAAASRPGKAGSSDGCTFRMRPGKARDEHRARAAACSRPGRRARRRARAARPAARASCSSRGRPAVVADSGGDPGRARALAGRARRRRSRSRPRSRRPGCPRAAASIRACRFEPRPLMRTPTASRRALTRRTTPRALHHGADHEARLAAALERVLDVVQVARAPRPRPCRRPC